MMKWSYRSNLIKKHIKNENADIIGLCELDCKDNYAKKFDNRLNQDGKDAHQDLVSYLDDLGYEKYIVERESGMNATGIFYKKDTFEIYFLFQQI